MPEQPADLPSWLEYISQQHPEVIDMGLERFSQVQRSLNLTQPAPKVITVAGTNGKGSTARVIEALLLDAGYSVGTTLSPHVWRFNERIRIGGEEASDATICAAFAAVDVARGDLPLTYFEFSALAALFVWLSRRLISPFWRSAWAVDWMPLTQSMPTSPSSPVLALITRHFLVTHERRSAEKRQVFCVPGSAWFWAKTCQKASTRVAARCL